MSCVTATRGSLRCRGMARCSARSNCGSSPCSPPSRDCAWLRSRLKAANLTGLARGCPGNGRSGRRNRHLGQTKEHLSARINACRQGQPTDMRSLAQCGPHYERLAHRNSDRSRPAPCPPLSTQQRAITSISLKSCSAAFPVRGSSNPSQHAANASNPTSRGVKLHTWR